MMTEISMQYLSANSSIQSDAIAEVENLLTILPQSAAVNLPEFFSASAIAALSTFRA